MPSISALADDFDTLDTGKWPNNYGNVSVSGSRGRIQTTGGVYGGWMTDAVYSVPDGASLSARIYADARSSATTDCYTALRILPPSPAGTDFGVMAERISANLLVENRVDYDDATPSTVAYSGTSMAFWRIRRSGSNVLVDTAPEASTGVPGTWTNRRTVAVPAWMSTATNLAVLFEAYRNNGTVGFSEIDYLNTTFSVGSSAASRTGMFF